MAGKYKGWALLVRKRGPQFYRDLSIRYISKTGTQGNSKVISQVEAVDDLAAHSGAMD